MSVKRRSGRVIVPIFLGLLVTAAGVGLMAWYNTRVPDGPIIGHTVVDDDTIAVVRRGTGSGAFPYVHRETAVGDVTWSEALFEHEEGVDPMVVGQVVSVRAFEARGHRQTHTFRFDDGEFMWVGAQPEPDSAAAPSSLLSATLADEHTLYHLFGGEAPQLIAVDVASGEERWRKSLEALPERAWAFAGGLAVTDGTGVVRVHAGEADPQPIGGPSASFCHDGEALYYLTLDGTLQRIEAAEPPVRERVAAGLPQRASLVGCGRFGGDLVLVLGDAATGTARQLLKVVGQDFTTLELGGEGVSTLQAFSVGGPLPRVLPLPVGGRRVAFVDLRDFALGAVLEGCEQAYELLVTPADSFLTGAGRVERITDEGVVVAARVEGWDPATSPLRHNHLSDGRVFLRVGQRLVSLEREDLSAGPAHPEAAAVEPVDVAQACLRRP